MLDRAQNHMAARKESNRSAPSESRGEGHPLVDLPPATGSILTVYNTFNDMVAISDHVSSFSAAVRFKLSSNLMLSLDSLLAIHDTLVQKLRISPAAWDALPNCTDCTGDELDAYVDISRPFTVGRLATEHDACIVRVKASLALMRRSIVKLNGEADSLIAQMTSDSTPPEPDYVQYNDRGCDGDCEGEECETDESVDRDMATNLDSFYTEVADTNGLCRELPPDAPRGRVVEECKAKCIEMHGCKGFTLYNGTLTHFEDKSIASYFYESLEVGDQVRVWKNSKYLSFSRCRNMETVLAAPGHHCEEERLPLTCGDRFLGCFSKASVYLHKKRYRADHLRNRCCFRASVRNEYTQESTECFIRPAPNPLASMDTSAIAKWIANLPSGEDDVLAKDFLAAAGHAESKGLNGPVVMAMGKYKLSEYLQISQPIHLRKFMCMVDAAQSGRAPEECLSATFLELYRKVHGIVDPIVFWGVKIVVSASIGGASWVLQAISRLMSTTKSYLKQYQWIDTPTNIEDAANKGTDGIFVSQAVAKLSGQLLLAYTNTMAMSPFVLATSAIYLSKKAMEYSWDQCWMVDKWLSYTDVSDPAKVDAVVSSSFGQGDEERLDFHDACLEEEDGQCNAMR